MTGPSQRWTLALELSNPTSGDADASSLALGRAHSNTIELIASEHVRPSPPRSADDDLFPALDRLLARAGLTPRDLNRGRIAVSVGPGGYTGLRVACAAAKLLAESVGASCVSVPTPLVALHAAGPAQDNRPRAVALASKADSAWLYIEHTADPTAERFITAANAPTILAEHHVSTLIADAHLPASIAAACEAASIPITPPRLSATACLHVSATRPDIDPVALVPVYAREPDAVTLWRKRH